jgi:hypothetical protein
MSGLKGGCVPSGIEDKKRLRVYNNNPESLFNLRTIACYLMIMPKDRYGIGCFLLIIVEVAVLFGFLCLSNGNQYFH